MQQQQRRPRRVTLPSRPSHPSHPLHSSRPPCHPPPLEPKPQPQSQPQRQRRPRRATVHSIAPSEPSGRLASSLGANSNPPQRGQRKGRDGDGRNGRDGPRAHGGARREAKENVRGDVRVDAPGGVQGDVRVDVRVDSQVDSHDTHDSKTATDEARNKNKNLQSHPSLSRLSSLPRSSSALRGRTPNGTQGTKGSLRRARSDRGKSSASSTPSMPSRPSWNRSASLPSRFPERIAPTHGTHDTADTTDTRDTFGKSGTLELSELSELSEYVASLGLPPALLPTVGRIYDRCASRIFLLENSSFMRATDAHLPHVIWSNGTVNGAAKGTANSAVKGTAKGDKCSGDNTTNGSHDSKEESNPHHGIERVERKSHVSRWCELAEFVGFHAIMATRCRIPTHLWLVNDPNQSSNENDLHNNHSESTPIQRIPRSFRIGCGPPQNLEANLRTAKAAILKLPLDPPINDLTQQIRRVEREIAGRAPRLKREGKFIAVVICTQGIPTIPTSSTSPAKSDARHESQGPQGPTFHSPAILSFQQALSSLSSNLPVQLVIRLCSDDKRTADLYQTIDAACDSCDVLDDFWGEAFEVYLHNPWLTYGIGLHRLREAGLAFDLLDYLDERPLGLEEIREFCEIMFVGSGGNGGNETNGRKETNGRNGKEDSSNSLHSLPHPRYWKAFVSQLEVLLERQTMQWNPVKKKLTSWIDVTRLEAIYGPKSQIPGTSFSPTSTSRQQPHQRQQPPHPSSNGEKRNSSPDAPPQNCHTHRRPPNPNHPSRMASSTATPNSNNNSNTNTNPNTNTNTNTNTNLTFDQILQRWSHKPPTFTMPNDLPTLLVTTPALFPPNNPTISPHEYFSKWNEFSKEAFLSCGGDCVDWGDEERKELLKRAVRKAKFFLHPDKLPKDLTGDQRKMMRYVWDCIQEGEEK